MHERPYNRKPASQRDTESTDAEDQEPDELESIVTDWLESNRESLVKLMAAILLAAAIAGLRKAYARLHVGLPTPEVEANVRRWAVSRASELMASLRQRLLDAVRAVAQTWEQTGHSHHEILDRVRAFLADPSHATRIAENLAHENRREAYENGRFQGSKALGTHFKRWITEEDSFVCRACRRNERARTIPMDDPFPSGHMHPPAHKWCRCDISYLITRRPGRG